MDCQRGMSIVTIQFSDALSTAKKIAETLDRMFGSLAYHTQYKCDRLDKV